MTSKDKTRDKLVGSMRKTKAGAGIGTDSAQSDTAAATPEVEQKVAVANTAKPVAKIDKRDGKSSQSARISADNYQSGRRVWPD